MPALRLQLKIIAADGAGTADGKPSLTGRKPPPENVTGKRTTVFKQFRALIDGPSILTKLIGDAETAAAAAAKYKEKQGQSQICFKPGCASSSTFSVRRSRWLVLLVQVLAVSPAR